MPPAPPDRPRAAPSTRTSATAPHTGARPARRFAHAERLGQARAVSIRQGGPLDRLRHARAGMPIPTR